MVEARYVHTNLVARDWRRLARFYQEVLGCTPVPPERHLNGQWLEDATGIPGAAVEGIHLRLPGCGSSGPTLEVFQYNQDADAGARVANRPGFGHIAFAVEDVEVAVESIIAAGGGALGDVVRVEVAGSGPITFVYATDPEGNIIELQRWDDWGNSPASSATQDPQLRRPS